MKDDGEGEGLDQDNKEKEALKTATKKVLSGLTAREAKVLRERFGISLDSDLTLEEVGKQFDITRQRIKEVEEKALEKLKHRKEQNKKEYICSFCGKRSSEVKRMIASESSNSNICNECITECFNLIRE